MKCENCPYFTGIECHGHGEYYGSCQLLEFCYKQLKRQKDVDYISTNMNDICYEETECLIKEKFNWKEKKF